MFITNASNFFLLSLPAAEGQLLAEQVDLCKRVMNIYRFMVMKKLMERATWEQLLYVILHVTSEVLDQSSVLAKIKFTVHSVINICMILLFLFFSVRT